MTPDPSHYIRWNSASILKRLPVFRPAIAIRHNPRCFGWHLHRVFNSKARLMSNQNIRSTVCHINPPDVRQGFLDFVLSLIGSIILTLNCRCQRLDLYFNPYVCKPRPPWLPFVFNFPFPSLGLYSENQETPKTFFQVGIQRPVRKLRMFSYHPKERSNADIWTWNTEVV